MKTDYYIFGNRICFSQWSRKGFAVFLALGREVSISMLAIHICQCALLKSARKGIIVTDALCNCMTSDFLNTENTGLGYYWEIILTGKRRGDDWMSNLKYNFIKRMY